MRRIGGRQCGALIFRKKSSLIFKKMNKTAEFRTGKNSFIRTRRPGGFCFGTLPPTPRQVKIGVCPDGAPAKLRAF